MNHRKNELPQAQAQSQLRCHQSVNPHLHKPGVAQAKIAMPSQAKKQPVAPPVYRPQQTTQAVQPKAVSSTPTRKQPVAPAAYRPQPVPKVLQTKTVGGQPPRAVQPPRRPVAPPVYRPESKKIVQPKLAAAASTRQLPHAPPVYRPQLKPIILQPKTSQAKRAVPVHHRTTLRRATSLQPSVIQPGCFDGLCAWIGSWFGGNNASQPELTEWEKRKAVIQENNLGLRSNVGDELRTQGGNAIVLNSKLDDQAKWEELLRNYIAVISRGAKGTNNTRLFYLENVTGSEWGENTLFRAHNSGTWQESAFKKHAGIYGGSGEEDGIFRSVMTWIDGYVMRRWPAPEIRVVRHNQHDRYEPLSELDDLT